MGSRGSPRPPLQRLRSQLPQMSRHLPLLLLLLLAVCAPTVRAQNGGCVLHSQSGDLITEDEWKVEFLTLQDGKHQVDDLEDTTENNVPYYYFINIDQIKSVTLTTYQEYFKVEIEGDKLVIKTGDNFKGSEPNWSSTLFLLQLDIRCGEASERNNLGVALNVRDTNNYKPEFEKESYTFTFPVPLTMGTELTAQQPIKGWDYDISGQPGSAEVRPLDGATGQEAQVADLFVASIAAWEYPYRDFTVRLATSRELRTTDPISFLVRVTDDGTLADTNPNSSDVKITFVPDLDNSVFNPSFQEPLYKAAIKDAKDVVEGAPLLAEPITFAEGEATSVSIQDGGAHLGVAADGFLDVKLASDGSVQLFWKETLDSEQLETFLQQPYALLILTAESEGASKTGHTVIHLALPGAYVVCEDPITCSCEDCPGSSGDGSGCEVCDDCTCEDCPSGSGEFPNGSGDGSGCEVCEKPEPCEECPSGSGDCPSGSGDGSGCEVCEKPEPCEECPSGSGDCPSGSGDGSGCEVCEVCEEPKPCSCEDCPSGSGDGSGCEVCEKPEPCSCEDCPCGSGDGPNGSGDGSGCEVCSCEDCPSGPGDGSGCEDCDSCEDPKPCSCEDCPCGSGDGPNGSGDGSGCEVCEKPEPCEECPSGSGDGSGCEVCKDPEPCSCESSGSDSGDGGDCSNGSGDSNSSNDCDCSCDDCPGGSGGDSNGCDDSNEVTPPPSVQLEFKTTTYVADLQSSAQVGDVVAQPELKNGDDVEDVVYSLEKGSPTAPLSALRISKSSGEVTVAVAPPFAGSYEYVVVAEAVGAYPARAQLLVRGPLVRACEDGGACFEMALDVTKVDESESVQLLSTSAPDVCDCCRYEILEGDDYFTVNAQSGEVRLKAVDREATVFRGAEEPVLRLELRISSCDDALHAHAVRNASRAGSRASDDRDFDDWVRAAEDSKNDPTKTVLLVVVQDVNDNAPVFDPASVVVGFPSAEIAAQLRAPSLYTAKATDRDIGDNAKIRYSVQASSAGAAFVTVHEETGALYPRSDASGAPADRTTAVVQATDRFGSPGDDGTNTQNLAITLRILEEKHLAELRVTGALPEEAEALLATASSSVRELRLLTATTVPAAGEAQAEEADAEAEAEAEGETKAKEKTPPSWLVVRARRDASAIAALDDKQRLNHHRDGEAVVTELRMVLYSLRNGGPEDATDFTGDLEKALQEAGYEAEADEASLNGGGNNGGNGGGGGGGGGSDSGLLAAVIVLGVLLGLALIGAGVVGYIYGIRPRMKNRQLAYNNLDSSQRSVISDVESLPGGKSMAADKLSLASVGMDMNAYPTAAAAAEMQATNLSFRLNGDGSGGGGGGGDYETRDDVSSDGYMRASAPEEDYEELATPPSSHGGDGGGGGGGGRRGDEDEEAYQARKTVIFNEDVDCIEIRM